MNKNECNICDIKICSSLSKEFIDTRGKAASICLSKNGFNLHAVVKLSGYINDSIIIYWNEPTDNDFNTYNDPQECTEWGAEVLAFLIIELFTDYTVARRSKKGTGFDYFLRDKKAILFQSDLAKLEVSGIDRETPSNTVKKRMKKKIEQASTSHRELSLCVVVTEFSSPKAGVHYATAG